MTDHIGFIGGGNMARSLIGGMIAKDRPADQLGVSEPDSERRTGLQRDFGVITYDDNNALAAAANIIVLAVKPQMMPQVITDLKPTLLQRQPLLVSIAAGVTMAALSDWLGEYTNIVRVMPNTPALVGAGASGLFAHSSVSADDRDKAQHILDAVGITRWVESEDMIDVVTGVSGSGPAYFFYVMEAMQASARSLGLNDEAARELVLQTALGAAQLAANSQESFETLRVQVTSPGGTTEKAILTLNEANCGESIKAAVNAATDRSRELAQLLTQQDGDSQ